MSPATATTTTKGERTRAAILDAALRIVSKAGLDGLTIGTLADATGMSHLRRDANQFTELSSRVNNRGECLPAAFFASGQRQSADRITCSSFCTAAARPRSR